jgi:hypothetical protein
LFQADLIILASLLVVLQDGVDLEEPSQGSPARDGVGEVEGDGAALGYFSGALG